MWATYYWANGTRDQKEKAVEILSNYASSALRFDYTENMDLELSGMFLQYRSILIISDWQDLKEKKNYNEISSTDFKLIREEQKQTCKDIDKQGIILYNRITSRKLDDISSGARQNVIAGLYNFVEVLVRLQKFELAIEICEYVLCAAPQNFHLQFKKKQDWLKTKRY
jgi:hypothetical protein